MIAERPVPHLPAEAACLEPFVDAGLLGPAEAQTGALIARLVPGAGDEAVLAAALCVRALELGNVCVVLDQVAGSVDLDHGSDGIDDGPVALPWPEPAAWSAALAASPAVTVRDAHSGQVSGPGAEPTGRPLVVDGERVYLERYWRYERRVGDRLLDLATSSLPLSVPAAQVAAAALDRYLPQGEPGSTDLQRRAIEVALQRRLTVVAGGPGTGKTYTIARLLAVLLEVAQASGDVPEVALCAPTGKAAARMTEALHHAVHQARVPAELAGRLLETEASTLHRLLGYRDGISFRHDATNPLPHDLVVIDEASMVDLPMMGKLLDALGPTAQLVMVGDPFQLASVEAGAVLSDVIGPAARHVAPARATGPLAESIVVLERVHRFDRDSAIAALADAVRDGDVDRALQVLADPAADDVHLVDPDDAESLRALRAEVADAAAGAVRSARDGEPAEALARATRLKVLCGSRHGVMGSVAWTEEIERRVERAVGGLRTSHRWYMGRPIIVTRNDYLTGVFNGDVGIVAAVDDAPIVAMVDASQEQGFRCLAPSQLDSLETWWAMTVHKSQGSEFDHAVVCLPAEGSPLLTNELLYTGITRGRKRVTLVASRAALAAAIQRPIVRASGLQARFWD